MGSFSFSCCVSGLPIEAGDKVRYLLLTQNPYLDGSSCYQHSIWFPRTCPLKAEYNDYGSVENVEEGPMQEVWIEGFQEDLIEKGIGDNTCHDSAIKKDMTFDDLLEAVRENRVEVIGDPYWRTRKEITPEEQTQYDAKQPDYVPTMVAVERILYDSVSEVKAFNVDNDPGFIRVRQTNYGKDIDLMLRAKKVLEKNFAVALCAGSGNYSDSMELRVFMSPGKDTGGHDRRDYTVKSKDKTLPTMLIEQAMIREDVWQVILQQRIPHREYNADYSKSTLLHITIADYRADMRKYVKDLISGTSASVAAADLLNKLQEAGKTYTEEEGNLLSKAFYRKPDGRDTHGTWLAAKCPVPGRKGPAEHLDLFVAKGTVPEAFVDAMAEFAFVHDILGATRFNWHPSYSVGPQQGNWKAQQTLLKAYSKICSGVLAKRKSDNGDYGEEE